MPKINFDEEQVFDAFIGQLLMDKGLFQEDKKQFGKIRHELRDELDEAIQMSVIDALTDEQMSQLDQLLNSDATDEDIERFFDGAQINYEEAVSKAMREFREKYLGTSEEPVAEAQPAPAQTIVSAQPEAEMQMAAVAVETQTEPTLAAQPVAQPAGMTAQKFVTGFASIPGAPVQTNTMQSTNDMTSINQPAVAPMGVPMQGAISETPGASNVEGMADMTTMTEGGM